MARPLRLEYSNALYHVTSRGDGQEDIYEEESDRESFLDILAHVCERMHWKVYGYCLMTNHYHLVVQTPEANLSKGMRQLNGVYTQAFNRYHGRVGHVFQGRYKAIHVDKDAYMLELSRYVVLNPVRAGMVRHAGQWAWSSYRAMIGQRESPDWLMVDELLGHFGRRRSQAVDSYKAFVREGRGQPKVWNNLRNQVYLGDEQFVKQHQKKIKKLEAKVGLDDVPKAQRQGVVRTLGYYERRYDDRDSAMTAAYLSGHYTLKAIGTYFNLHYSSVSRIVKQEEEILQ